MKYELELNIDEENKDELLKVLSEYVGDLGRAKVSAEKKNKIIVHIYSEDISAMRAAINSVTNAIKVFEKTKKLIGEQNE